MSKNYILLINGSTGVGKTATAIEVAKKYTKGASIDADTVRGFVRTGDPGWLGYEKEIEAMKSRDNYYKMMLNAVCDVALRFYKEGYVVTISDMIWTDWVVDLYRGRFKECIFYHVVLESEYESHKKRLVERLQRDKVFHSLGEVEERVRAFSQAISSLSPSKYIKINTGNKNINEVTEMLLSGVAKKFIQTTSSQ